MPDPSLELRPPENGFSNPRLPLVTPFFTRKVQTNSFPLSPYLANVWLPTIFSTDVRPWLAWFARQGNGQEGTYYFLVLANFELHSTHLKHCSRYWPPFIPLLLATETPPTSCRLSKKSRRVLWQLLSLL